MMNRSIIRWLLALALLGMIGLAVALRERFDVAALPALIEGAGAAAPMIFGAV
jgi:uncharacterized membrane protein YdjX (TVP38/TMEM64 family)